MVYSEKTTPNVLNAKARKQLWRQMGGSLGSQQRLITPKGSLCYADGYKIDVEGRTVSINVYREDSIDARVGTPRSLPDEVTLLGKTCKVQYNVVGRPQWNIQERGSHWGSRY